MLIFFLQLMSDKSHDVGVKCLFNLIDIIIPVPHRIGNHDNGRLIKLKAC